MVFCGFFEDLLRDFTRFFESYSRFLMFLCDGVIYRNYKTSFFIVSASHKAKRIQKWLEDNLPDSLKLETKRLACIVTGSQFIG
jgi:hypothetical protein